MLTFTGKQGSHPENVTVAINRANVGEDKLTISVSPVKYTADGTA